MDGSNGGSNAPAPFLTKTYEMVDDPMTNSIVSWNHTGHSFIVWNPPEFARDLLPKYFKHNNFSSFIRQLNTYGFRKIDPDQWEFANEEFIRGHRHLLKNIYRRKPIHSHSAQGNAAVSLSDTERKEFEEEIEKLKREKNMLESELERHKLENKEYQIEFNSLGERVKNIDDRQRQLLAFLAQLLQKPGFVSDFVQQSEMHSKKRRLLVSNYLYDEAHMIQSPAVVAEPNPSSSLPVVNAELVEKLDSSVNFWEKFLYGIYQSSAEELFGFPQPSSVTVTALDSSSGDSDVNIQPCSSNSLRRSPSGEILSPQDMAVSPDHIQSATPSTLNLDWRPKSSGAVVSTSSVDVPETVTSKDRASALAPNAANDGFWQQFLTESPGASATPEVQSERNNPDARKSDSMFADHHRFWWNTNNVQNLTEQMGHLTPTEKT
ncbi:OLC1v1023625C1 [Oldenlandia corymbosa var. corymbosa]|uniref:Heat stress transcription factor n=1 Tax=Oldenlandia corymbosa var. corymbosa TaxID=529605 RepID=A0AAV1C0S3_OLDCO|nr:OLC1v1023625C1 [Oldenlandia corymbosa var. corymbosa]